MGKWVRRKGRGMEEDRVTFLIQLQCIKHVCEFLKVHSFLANVALPSPS
jgi:hypothetical protein